MTMSDEDLNYKQILECGVWAELDDDDLADCHRREADCVVDAMNDYANALESGKDLPLLVPPREIRDAVLTACKRLQQACISFRD